MTLSVARNQLWRPSYRHGFARGPADSDRPQDWSGLVGLWIPQLGPSGSLLRDWSGRGYHGTLTSMDVATDWVLDPEKGDVLDFDGVNDHVVIAGFDPHTYGQFTILAWYKSTDASASDDEYIWAHTEGTGQVDRVFFGPTDDSGEEDKLRIVIGHTTGFSYYGTSDVVDQTWHMLGAVRTDSRVKMYVDAVEESDTADSATGAFTVDGSSGPWIGDFPGQTERVHGRIAQVRLYDCNLSANHMRSIYEDPLGIVRPRRRRIPYVPAVVAGGFAHSQAVIIG